MKPTLFVAVCSAVFGVVGVAPRSQSFHVVPSQYAAAEASSGGSIAGFGARYRQQVLLSSSALQALQGKLITALWFRRNESLGLPYQGSASNIRVQLSQAALPPVAPSVNFVQNRGATVTTVFSGTVGLSATPPPPMPIPWSSPFAVRIGFTAAYAYLGGDLCIEIEGTPQSPPANLIWWVDYAREGDVGRVQIVGSACGAATTESVTTANASILGAVPGATFKVQTFGWPATLGALMIGSKTPPVSLASLGATGCHLYTLPLVQLPGVFGSPMAGDTFGPLKTAIPIPANAAFVGAGFSVQGSNVEPSALSNPAGLTTTNGLDVTLALTMPPGTMATVDSRVVGLTEPFPTTGTISLSRAPVIRFETQ